MARHFSMQPLRVNNFVKVNNLQEIVNPIFFNRNNQPTPDGLLSNEIFGITKDERANIFAYIKLGNGEVFMHPLHYKIWCKLDSKIKACVHGTKSFIVNDKGELVEDDNGKSGIKFLKNNIDKLKIRPTESSKRDKNIEFLMKNKDTMFIDKMPVIPAYFRDINTDSAGFVGVGDINKLYNGLIISIRSLNESSDYGLTLADTVRGRVQELILDIYNWFAMEPNISKKNGILRRANLSKTTDYSARIVISAPNLKVEHMDDLMVDIDHSALPLAAVIANFFPFMVFYLRRFFENEFAGNAFYSVVRDGKVVPVKVKDYQIEFSDQAIKKQLDRFMHGYSNRFIPIEIPLEEKDNKNVVYMRFKGYSTTKEQMANKAPGSLPLVDRDLTWCDLIYMAACHVTQDKTVLITRYPMDGYFNQFPTKIVVSSTKDTEPMVVNNIFYKHYPKIRQSDIGKNTSNSFIDTLNMCNAYLGSIGGDYE